MEKEKMELTQVTLKCSNCITYSKSQYKKKSKNKH